MNDSRMLRTSGVRTDGWRWSALAGGVLYLMTFIFSIPAVFLYGPVLTDPAYILSAGADSQVLIGALFDLITALCIGTAVALYPVIKQSSAASIGFVATRIFEAGVIVIGVVCLMAVVNLRQAGATAGTDASALVAVGQGLVAVRDVTFLVGPGVMPGLNALLLGYVLDPVATRAACDPGDGAHRRPAVPGCRSPFRPWPQRAGFAPIRDCFAPDLLLGAVGRTLAHLQGLQALGCRRPCL